MNGQQAKETDYQRIEKEAQNMPLEIGFKRLSDNAILPTKAFATDSGFDLYASEDVIIVPCATVVIPTDISVVLPQGYEAQVRPRSGVSSKTKLRVVVGTIDNSYRGPIGVICDNISFAGLDFDFRDADLTETSANIVNVKLHVKRGDRIAQLVVQPIPATVAVEITGELDGSDRGTNGFGSSGV